jgi:hypothetical protein
MRAEYGSRECVFRRNAIPLSAMQGRCFELATRSQVAQQAEFGESRIAKKCIRAGTNQGALKMRPTERALLIAVGPQYTILLALFRHSAKAFRASARKICFVFSLRRRGDKATSR